MPVDITIAVEVLSTPDTLALAGLTPKAWWRPEELREDYGNKTSGTVITDWRDASGNGYNLTATVGPTWQPYFSDSSWWFPGASFNGTTQWMTSGQTVGTLFGANGVGTVFVVGRARAANAGPFWSQNVANGSYLQAGATIVARHYDGTADDAAISTDLRVVEGDDTETTFKVLCWVHDATHVRAGYMGASAGMDDSSLSSTSTGNTSSTTSLFDVGVQTTSFFKGAISEVIVFDSALTEVQKRAVMRYFRKKYGFREDEDLTGVTWTDVSGDVRANEGVSLNYGLPGASINDRVADTGRMDFTLDNSEKNVNTLRGYYTPGHANAWAGWGLGSEVRLKLTYGATTYYKWRGYVNALEIPPGMQRQAVTVRCVDWMDVAARAALRGADSAAQLQTSKRSDQVLRHLVGRFETPPPSVTLGYGSDTYPYALDNSDSESTVLMSEFQRLANSELGYVYVKGDTTRGGNLVFESRLKRGQKTSSLFTLDQTRVLDLVSSYSVDDITNEVQVQIFPRRVDSAATTILFALQDAPAIARGTAQAYFCPFRDPSGKFVRVGGAEMVTPVASTDYTFNTLATGAGTDITSQITVAVSWAANGANVAVLNAGPLDGYLTKLQLRGKGIYANESVVFTAGDAASQAAYGKRVERFDMPYQSSPLVGLDAAFYALNQGKDAKQRLRSVVFLANGSDAEATAALTREISDRITVQDTTSGGYLTPDAINGDFFIQAVSMSVSSGRLIRVSWTLAPADTDAYWLLQTTGFTELGDTTRLSYGLFSPQWQLDVSQLGVDTIVNA